MASASLIPAALLKPISGSIHAFGYHQLHDRKNFARQLVTLSIRNSKCDTKN